MKVESADCPACGRRMIRQPTGTILTSNPPQTEMQWWCDCGYRAPAGADPITLTDPDELTRSLWHVAQREDAAYRRLNDARPPWWKFWAW